MSEPLKIRSYRHEYRVDFVSDHLAALRTEARPGDWFIIDGRVRALYPGISSFMAEWPHFEIDACEEQKSYEALAPMLQRLVEARFTRSQRLIAIGGGVTQDVTAFIASILLRGVDWIFFPTNLLTQCDSCIGSKTSINLGPFKNQLGTFFPPRQIYLDLGFLDTLPPEELRAGLGEILHYLLVTSEDDLVLAEQAFEPALTNRATLRRLVERSLEIKAAMVPHDEFDRGPRNIFNYGHSFGHAIETATAYRVPHGTAVGFGMDIANVLSAERDLIASSLRNRIRRVIALVVAGAHLDDLSPERFLDALARDKKNERGVVNVILTRGLGAMFKTPLDINDAMKTRLARYFEDKEWTKDL